MRLATANTEPANRPGDESARRRTGEPATAPSTPPRRLAASPSPRPAIPPPRRFAGTAAFTLVEVLAAMMFMAIVIPVAIEALHVASRSGEIAVRKAAAARIADRVLNENIVSTNWNQYLTGSLREEGLEFQWTLRNEFWSPDSALQLVTAEVEFSAQGRVYSVRSSTLANSTSSGTTSALP
jgi:type II secretory pathway pseudopilin PulG